jgi:hypothetical protein
MTRKNCVRRRVEGGGGERGEGERGEESGRGGGMPSGSEQAQACRQAPSTNQAL